MVTFSLGQQNSVKLFKTGSNLISPLVKSKVNVTQISLTFWPMRVNSTKVFILSCYRSQWQSNRSKNVLARVFKWFSSFQESLPLSKNCL